MLSCLLELASDLSIQRPPADRERVGSISIKMASLSCLLGSPATSTSNGRQRTVVLTSRANDAGGALVTDARADLVAGIAQPYRIGLKW